MYPRLEAYLRKLPNGIDAHPGAKLKASIVREALASRPFQAASAGDLPESLRMVLRDAPLPSTWLPVTHVVGVLLTLADQDQLDDEAFIRWRHAQYRALFRSALYRALFAVVPTETLVAGAVHKWKSLAKDSLVLERVTRERGHAEILVRWPEHLLAPIVARSQMEGVRAALEISGAKNPQVEIGEITTSHALYRLRWEAR